MTNPTEAAVAVERDPDRTHGRPARRWTGMLSLSFAIGGCASTTTRPAAPLHYQRIVLSTEPIEQPLLNGPPQTAGMRSGRVVLKPGEDMHRHSTKENEELLVFLQGQARVVVGSETVTMEAGQVLYIPPHLEHEVHNDGHADLTYIYTVAPTGR